MTNRPLVYTGKEKITWAKKEAYDFKYPSTYIVAAAIIYDSRIIAGMRHNICFMQLKNEGLKFDPKLQTGDGFLDNHGVFHDRQVAMEIAITAKQVSTDQLDKDLYSEDLW